MSRVSAGLRAGIIVAAAAALVGCNQVQTYNQQLRPVLEDARRDAQRGPFHPDWKSLSRYQVPAWYRDAKFGIFVFWGPYSVPAFGNELYAHDMYVEPNPAFEHHIRTYGPQIKFGYKDFIPRFTAGKFDPDNWGQLFRKAGAKYVIAVAEHHDGFSLYNNPLTGWNAVNMGPKKDLLSLVAGGVRRHGMIFGVSSHRAEHWWTYEGGMQFESDVKEAANDGLYGPHYPRKTGYGDESQPTTAFLEDWFGRIAVLVKKYRPQVLWLDGWAEQPVFEPYRQQLAAYYYNSASRWGRDVVLNYRLGAYPEKAAVLDVERGRFDAIRPLPWQESTSVVGNSFGYVRNAHYRTAGAIIGDLADAVSKNGNLLLGVGPRADGTIPQETERLLLGIGRWLEVNGEAIYGTRPWKTFGEGPTQGAAGSLTEAQQATYTAEDIRFTQKDGVLYAIALGWPSGRRLVIKSLASGSPYGVSTVREVALLGSAEALKWSQTPEGLVIELPAAKPCDHAICLRVRVG